MSKKLEFSITFKIFADKNPDWHRTNTDINFPPFTVQNNIKVFCVKQASKFKVFILHPKIGYRKLTADIKKYIGKDTFVAITVSEGISKLYLNAELLSTTDVNETIKNVEIGDFVVVKVEKNDFKNLKINLPEKINLGFAAQIKKVNESRCYFFIFDLKSFVELPINRILH